MLASSGLKLLTSGDPPNLVSQSVSITGVSHCTQPGFFVFVFNFFFLFLEGVGAFQQIKTRKPATQILKEL